MRPPHNPDVELVCTGSRVFFGSRSHGASCLVAQTPREVRELMHETKTDLIELSHHGDREVPAYVNQYQITAIIPYWDRVEE